MLARASLAALFGFLLLAGFSAPLKPRSCLLSGESYGWSPTRALERDAPRACRQRPMRHSSPDTFLSL